MINRNTIKNNSSLGLNVSQLKNFLPGGKILVIKDFIEGLNIPLDGTYYINDFFNAIICEGLEAARSVPNPDFIVFDQPSIYKNNLLAMDQLKEFRSSLILTNYSAIQELGRVNLTLDIYNVNYIPSGEGVPNANPTVVRGVTCGLSKTSPGVHLALILGGTQIFYTGEGTTYDMLVSHAASRSIGVPTNIMAPKRTPFLSSRL